MTRSKNSTRLVALLMALVLVTSCFVGGTLARYITSTSSEDSARVAVWGINADEVEMDLFDAQYELDGTVVAKANDGDNIIAPGTGKMSKFSIVNLDDTLVPEVMYEIKIDLDDTEIDQRILDNPSIQWKLDNNDWGTWSDTKADILMLSGDASGVKTYAPNEIATEFTNGKEHTISWQWMLDDNNVQDTAMGNEAIDEDITAKIVVKVTAEQTDGSSTGMLNGNGQTFYVSNPEELVFRSAAPLSELQSVEINGVTLTKDTDYTATEGSTVITLKTDYLSKLELGTYKISIVSTNMTATTNFNIVTVLDNGNCGENLTWELLSNGTLHISGTGPMYDYVKNKQPSPWYKYRNEPYISESGTQILNPDGTGYDTVAHYKESNPNGYKVTNIQIDEGVTYIGNWAFYRVGVEELTIPEGVTSTGHFAIRFSPTLKKVNLPNSLKELGDFGISRNQLLETINFGNGLEKLGTAALVTNPKLKSVILPDSVTQINEQLNEPYGDVSYENQGLLAEAYSLKTVDLGSVTYIPQRTFLNCTSLETITIPNTVEYIEEYAFFNTTSLKTVKFEENSKCKTIGNSAFRYAPIESLTGATALETIEDLAFNGAKFKEFEFSDTNVSFPDNIFSSKPIETAIIGPNVTKLSTYMFMKSNLKEIYISKNLQEFGQGCLREVSTLENIYYDGTREDWNNITKGINWAYLTPDNTYSTVVHFSDGTTDILKNVK